MVFFGVCQFSHVLRDLVPNALVADRAHQQVQLFAVRLSRGAALRRNQSFCIRMVETFPTGGDDSKYYLVIQVRDFISKAGTVLAGHAHQDVHVFALLSRIADLLHY